jgi:hypothetical protein
VALEDRDWGGREFRTKADLQVWLGERGLGYREWAARYPAAAKRFEQGR